MDPEDLNPQAEQMAHASMLTTLRLQLEASWPQEVSILQSYRLPTPLRVIDVGCGPGLATRRIAEMFRHAVVDAIDVDEDHVERARHACIDFADRVTVRRGDAFDIDAPSGTYDLVVCRHVLQSIPHPDRVIRELARITRPGGRLHIVAEDYGMIHFHPCRPETDEFFSRGPVVFGKALGTDLRIGRRIYSILRDLDLTDIRLDYLVLDTLRVPRTTLAGIFEAWREGYTDAIARNSDLATAQILESWADMIECTRNPDGYAVWLLPVAGATPGPLVA